MRFLRVATGAAGVVLMAVGLYYLLPLGLGNLFHTGVWLAGGVIAHDLVFALVVVGIGFFGARLLPRWAAAPIAAGAIVPVTVTLTVFPTLGRFGAKPTDPTLLDRPYGLAWLGFAGIVVGCTAVACALNRSRTRGEHTGGR